MQLRATLAMGVAITCLAAGCSFPPPPQQSTEAEMLALPTARLCEASLPVFGRFFFPGDVAPGAYIPPDGNIRMSNDSGWCQLTNTFVFREVVTTGTMSLATPPIHGEVRTGTVGQQLRIAYRPSPGFTGTDGFVVHLDTPQPWDIPVHVVVVP
jgi:hypothetical protein